MSCIVFLSEPNITNKHSNRSAISVVGLGENGTFTTLLSTSYSQLEGPVGPFASRQDRSYAHHAILDPTKKFIMVPDIGADMVRVFSFNPDTLALTEQAFLRTDPGAGPRHGLFWRSDAGVLYFMFTAELSQKVYTYQVSYTGAGLSWTKVSEIVALGNDNAKPPGTAPPSEIALSVSIPNTHSST